MTDKKDQEFKFDTLALHGGQAPDPATGASAVPIFQTASFAFDSAEHALRLFSLEEFGNIYTRITNPTTQVLEERLALMEGGLGALALSSGQAATTLSLLNIAQEGDEIVSARSLYGGTYNLLNYTFPKMGIKVRFVDGRDPENFAREVTENTKAFFAESLSNPRLDILDIERVAQIAHQAGVPLIVDNTLTTPYLVKPFQWGADLVVHSITKFVGGHGLSIGGAIIDSGNFPWEKDKHPGLTEPDPSYHGLCYTETFGKMAYIIKARLQMLRDLGSCISPFNSFTFLQGLETLHLRMERHSENALSLARYLEKHPKVSWVSYPGLERNDQRELAQKYFYRDLYGAMLGFGIKGGRESGRRFIENLKIFYHLANLGDARSLALHPASTTHFQLSPQEQEETGVTEDYIRLSVGIEDIEDIIDDVDQALNKA